MNPMKGSIIKLGKRKAFPAGLNAKARARLKSRQVQSLTEQSRKIREKGKVNPEKSAAQQRMTFGETNVDAARRILSDERNMDRMSVHQINHEIATAGVMRILNAGRVHIDPRDARQVMGNSGKILERFAKRVPSEHELWKYIPGPKRGPDGKLHYPQMKRFKLKGAEAKVYIEQFSLPRKWKGQKPDRVVQVLNERLQNVPFLPPRAGEIVSKDLGIIRDMAPIHYPPVRERYRVMGWILLEDYSSGRGAAHHMQVYLQKIVPKKAEIERELRMKAQAKTGN